MTKVLNSIDINNLPLETPLYCVYGSSLYTPQIFMCKISAREDNNQYIWGYSKWEGEWGFRTMGVKLSSMSKHKIVSFFDTKEYAIEYISKLMTFKNIQI